MSRFGGDLTTLFQATLFAASASVFFAALIGKLFDIGLLKSWLNRWMAARWVPVGVAAILLFDVGAFVLILVAAMTPLGSVLASFALTTLLLVRIGVAARVQDCPCFGGSARPHPHLINGLAAALLSGHLASVWLVPVGAMSEGTELALTGGLVGAHCIAILLNRTGSRSLSSGSTKSGVLSSEETEALLSAMGGSIDASTERAIVVVGHPGCSACHSIASALISISRILPEHWLRALDMSNGVRSGNFSVRGVPVASLAPSLRNMLGIRASPALTIIERSGKFVTHQGADACRRAITDLVAEL